MNEPEVYESLHESPSNSITTLRMPAPDKVVYALRDIRVVENELAKCVFSDEIAITKWHGIRERLETGFG